MTQLPITFEAALRDADAVDLKARTLALTHLGSAYLERLGRSEPLWLAHTHDERGPEVLAALLRAVERDPAPPIQALAATGLGQLGAPELLAVIPDEWFTRSDSEAAYQRECAAIGWTLLGQAAKPVSGDMPQDTYDAVIERLRAGLRADQPELRFQCAAGLAELEGRAAEDDLVAALARETTPQIRGALVTAIGELDPPGPRACEVEVALCGRDAAGERDRDAAAGGCVILDICRGGPGHTGFGVDRLGRGVGRTGGRDRAAGGSDADEERPVAHGHHHRRGQGDEDERVPEVDAERVAEERRDVSRPFELDHRRPDV